MSGRFPSSLRLISALLVLSFLAEQAGWAAPEIQPVDIFRIEKPRLDIAFPASVATVEDTYLADSGQRTRDDTLVYLIQDAHTNYSGQINLAKTLEVLFSKDPGLKNVFVEAGFGNDSLSFLREKAPLAKRKEVGETYLRKGILHGEEYLDLTSERTFSIWGVEDRTLYDKAIEAYRATAKNRVKFERYLHGIRNAIQTLKPRILNPALLAFDEERSKYLKDETSLTEYFDLLASQAKEQGISLLGYPHLLSLRSLKEKEAGIDFKKANAEQAEALKSLPEEDRNTILGLEEKEKSLVKIFADRGGETQAYFAMMEEKLLAYRKIEDPLTLNAVRSTLKSYPQLFKYFKYLKEAKRLDPKWLLLEQKALEAEIVGRLAENQDERAILRCQDSLRSLEKLFALTLTPEEFGDYQASVLDIRHLTGFLNKKIMELGDFYERATFLEDGFDALVKDAEIFYLSTRERDEAFVEKMLEKLRDDRIADRRPQTADHGRRTAALIAGGFHTTNLKKLLRARGISYVSIAPQVYHETNQKRYESLLLNQKILKTPFLIPSPYSLVPKESSSASKVGMARLAAVADTTYLPMITRKISEAAGSRLASRVPMKGVSERLGKIRAGRGENVTAPYASTAEDELDVWFQGNKSLRNIRKKAGALSGQLLANSRQIHDLITKLKEKNIPGAKVKSLQRQMDRIRLSQKALLAEQRRVRLKMQKISRPNGSATSSGSRMAAERMTFSVKGAYDLFRSVRDVKTTKTERKKAAAKYATLIAGSNLNDARAAMEILYSVVKHGAGPWFSMFALEVADELTRLRDGEGVTLDAGAALFLLALCREIYQDALEFNDGSAQLRMLGSIRSSFYTAFAGSRETVDLLHILLKVGFGREFVGFVRDKILPWMPRPSFRPNEITKRHIEIVREILERADPNIRGVLWSSGQTGWESNAALIIESGDPLAPLIAYQEVINVLSGLFKFIVLPSAPFFWSPLVLNDPKIGIRTYLKSRGESLFRSEPYAIQSLAPIGAMSTGHDPRIGYDPQKPLFPNWWVISRSPVEDLNITTGLTAAIKNPPAGSRLTQGPLSFFSWFPRLKWTKKDFSIYGDRWLLRARLKGALAIEDFGLKLRGFLGPVSFSFYRGNFISPEKRAGEDLYVLGISGSWHDATAALFKNGTLIGALEEERMTRQKHETAQFPINAILSLLSTRGLTLEQIDHIAIGWNYNRNVNGRLSQAPSLEFFRQMDRDFASATGKPLEKLQHRDVQEKNAARNHPDAIPGFLETLREATGSTHVPRVSFVPHHLAHAASSYYSSGFKEPTLVFTFDGYGDEQSATVWIGKDGELTLVDKIDLPDSLGWVYSAVTEYLGFKPLSAEGEVMGLAPYGFPKDRQERERLGRLRRFMRRFIRIYPESGRFGVNPEFVYYGPIAEGRVRITAKMMLELGSIVPPYRGTSQTIDPSIHRDYANLAYALQERTEEAVVNTVLYHLRHNPNIRGIKKVAMAGGVTLNINVNKAVLTTTQISPKDFFVPPMANDPGTAIGAAQIVLKGVYGVDPSFSMNTAAYGVAYSDAEIEKVLKEHGLKESEDYIRFNGPEDLTDRVAVELSKGKVVAWFQGPSEIGPRALGNRSLLLSASDPRSHARANQAKHRQPWRPSALSMTGESAQQLLSLNHDGQELLPSGDIKAPFMIVAYDVREKAVSAMRSGLHPANQTTRPQTIARDENPLFYAVLEKLGRRTGLPAVVNTSLNQKEPLVESPGEALNVFYYMPTADFLCIGDFLVLHKPHSSSVRSWHEESRGEPMPSGLISAWDSFFDHLRNMDREQPDIRHESVVAVLINQRGERSEMHWPLLKEIFEKGFLPGSGIFHAKNIEPIAYAISAAIYNKALAHGVSTLRVGSSSPKYNLVIHQIIEPYFRFYEKLGQFVNFGRSIRIQPTMNSGSDRRESGPEAQMVLRAHPDDKTGTAIGVDVGASFIKIGLIRDGEVLYQNVVKTPKEGGEALASVINIEVRRVYNKLNAEEFPGKAEAIGIAWPGVVSMIQGKENKVEWLVDLEAGWNAKDSQQRKMHYDALNNLRRIFEEQYGVPVWMINDVRAFGVAEMILLPGSIGPGSRHTLLAIGTSVGDVSIEGTPDGPVIDFNRPHQEAAAVVDLSPAAMPDKNREALGMLSSLLNNQSWNALAAKQGMHDLRAVLSEKNGGDYPKARSIVKQQAVYLAAWINHYAPILAFKRVLLSGGTMAGGLGEVLAEETNGLLQQQPAANHVRVELSKISPAQGGMIGGGLFALAMAKRAEKTGARLARNTGKWGMVNGEWKITKQEQKEEDLATTLRNAERVEVRQTTRKGDLERNRTLSQGTIGWLDRSTAPSIRIHPRQYRGGQRQATQKGISSDPLSGPRLRLRTGYFASSLRGRGFSIGSPNTVTSQTIRRSYRYVNGIDPFPSIISPIHFLPFAIHLDGQKAVAGLRLTEISAVRGPQTAVRTRAAGGESQEPAAGKAGSNGARLEVFKSLAVSASRVFSLFAGVAQAQAAQLAAGSKSMAVSLGSENDASAVFTLRVSNRGELIVKDDGNYEVHLKTNKIEKNINRHLDAIIARNVGQNVFVKTQVDIVSSEESLVQFVLEAFAEAERSHESRIRYGFSGDVAALEAIRARLTRLDERLGGKLLGENGIFDLSGRDPEESYQVVNIQMPGQFQQIDKQRYVFLQVTNGSRPLSFYLRLVRETGQADISEDAPLDTGLVESFGQGFGHRPNAAVLKQVILGKIQDTSTLQANSLLPRAEAFNVSEFVQVAVSRLAAILQAA